MKTKVILIFYLIALTYLSSCTNTETKTATPTTENEWLQNPACQFPCWQNVTPQETKFDDAMRILGQANFPISFTDIDEHHIDFQLQNHIAGTVYRAFSGSVDSIVLNVAYQNITLGDLEQVMGPLEKVSVAKSLTGDTCNIVAVYETKDTAVTLIPLANQTSPVEKVTDCTVDVESDSQISRISLFGNTSQSELWKNAYANLQFMEWNGYGKYP